jgi:hypothetical protein
MCNDLSVLFTVLYICKSRGGRKRISYHDEFVLHDGPVGFLCRLYMCEKVHGESIVCLVCDLSSFHCGQARCRLFVT